MNRRTLLTSIATLPAIGLAGCIDQLASNNSDSISLPDPVSELEFQITDTNFNPEDDPSISFNKNTGEVTIKGTIWVGSNKCKEAILNDVSYNESDMSIEINISHGKSDKHPDNKLLGGSCDEAMSADGYKAKLSVENEVQTITVIESDAEGNKQRASASR